MSNDISHDLVEMLYKKHESNSNKEKFQHVVKETVINTNRVLAVWKVSKKGMRSKDYDDVKSLFNSFFVKYLKREFGWRITATYITGKFSYIPIVCEREILAGISFENSSQLTVNDYAKCLNEVIENFDFLKCHDLNPSDIIINTDLNKLEFTSNYNHITNIKF